MIKVNYQKLMSEELSSEHCFNTYRYKFSPDMTDALNEFAKIHQYSDRDSYKEAWSRWYNNQKDVIDTETQRLNSLGYEGNVEDKMYKSARYYFRNKSNKKSEPKRRRKYISMDRNMLDAMDIHVETYINTDGYTPSWGYNNFCTNNVGLLKDEIKRISTEGELHTNDIIAKVKKTYKNRHFQYTNQIAEITT